MVIYIIMEFQLRLKRIYNKSRVKVITKDRTYRLYFDSASMIQQEIRKIEAGLEELAFCFDSVCQYGLTNVKNNDRGGK